MFNCGDDNDNDYDDATSNANGEGHFEDNSIDNKCYVDNDDYSNEACDNEKYESATDVNGDSDDI